MKLDIKWHKDTCSGFFGYVNLIFWHINKAFVGDSIFYRQLCFQVCSSLRCFFKQNNVHSIPLEIRTVCESVDELSLHQTKIPTRPKHTSDPKRQQFLSEIYAQKIDSGSMFILRISGWIYIDSDCNINSPTSRFIQTTDCRDIIYIYIYTSHVSCITYSYTLVAGGRLCIEWHFDAKKIAKCPMISAIRTISPWRKHVSIGSSDWSLQRFTPTTVHRSTWGELSPNLRPTNLRTLWQLFGIQQSHKQLWNANGSASKQL